VIGEGGSGGALAIAVADRVLMMENSVYSVISPEGGAAILWKDSDQRRKAAAPSSRRPASASSSASSTAWCRAVGGANKDYDRASRMLGDAIAHAFETIEDESPDLRRRRRRARFRELGVWLETTVTDDDVLASDEVIWPSNA